MPSADRDHGGSNAAQAHSLLFDRELRSALKSFVDTALSAQSRSQLSSEAAASLRQYWDSIYVRAKATQAPIVRCVIADVVHTLAVRLKFERLIMLSEDAHREAASASHPMDMQTVSEETTRLLRELSA